MKKYVFWILPILLISQKSKPWILVLSKTRCTMKKQPNAITTHCNPLSAFSVSATWGALTQGDSHAVALHWPVFIQGACRNRIGVMMTYPSTNVCLPSIAVFLKDAWSGILMDWIIWRWSPTLLLSLRQYKGRAKVYCLLCKLFVFTAALLRMTAN